MLDRGERRIESLERMGPDMYERGAVEHVKPKFAPLGLEFGETRGKRTYDRGGVCLMRERRRLKA